MGNELFEKAPIHTAYLKLAIPVVLSMVVTLIYNMVDTYFIALTNNTALIAGVSICAPLFTLFLAFGDIFALGGSSVISRLLGAHKNEEAKQLSVFCHYAAIAFSLLVTVIMLLLANPILTFLGADNTTFPYARQYYHYIVLGCTFIIFSLVPTNLMRTVGHPNASMIAQILGAVVNMVLDPVFIFTLHMGAAGAAIATIIGYMFSTAFSLWFIITKCEGLSVLPKDYGISRTGLFMVFSIGLPASVTNFMQTIGMTLTNRSLSLYGSDSIAVMGIVLKIVNIVMLVIIGLAFGGQPLIGYVFGAENRTRLRHVIAFAYRIVGGVATVLAILVALFSDPLIHVFLQDPELIAEGRLMLRLQMPSMLMMGLGLVTICTFQAMGKGLPALIMSLCRQGVVFAVVLSILSHLFGYMGILTSQLAADLVTTVIAAGLFLRYIKSELRMSTPQVLNN